MTINKSSKHVTTLQSDLEHLSVLINAMPDIVCFKDGEGRWLQANNYDLELFGLKDIDYKGKTDSELAEYSSFYRDAFLGCEESDEAAWQKGSMLKTQEIIPLPDGSANIFDIIKVPLFHEDGSRRGLVVLGRDVTAQKKYEAELERLNKTFAEAQRVAKIGHWLWNIKTDSLEWSDEVFRIFGCKPREFTPTYDRLMKFIHPYDRQRVKDAVIEALKTGNRYSIEHGIIIPGERYRTVKEEGRLYYDADNEPEYMLGVVLDTTEFKSIENQLDLATQLLENIIEGVAITDQDTNILMVNQAFTQITGYGAEDAIGRKPSILKSERQDASFYESMWQEINNKGKWSGEIWNRRKNGEVYPEWLTILAIKDVYAKSSGYVSIFHDLTEIKSHQETIKIKEYRDPLTGLANRKLFMDHLETEISKSESGQELAVVCLDVDAFKRINDSLGHVIGDKLLQDVAIRLWDLVDEENTVARLGGDEFCILLQGEDIVVKSVEIVESILNTISAPFSIKNEEVTLTASVGISIFPFDGLEAQKLFKNAELAMYEAKRSGNTYKYFKKELDVKARKRLRVENALRLALQAEDELVVFYQPKVELATGRIAAMEALVRWSKPDGTMISPGEFIPLAEETGLVLPLGDWVLRKALQATKKWLQAGIKISVAVNLSPLQFRDEKLLKRIMTAISDSGFPPNCLELEITESAVLEREKQAIAVLSKLQDLGISISLDDFGTGYSSLYYLKKLPINSIKIDKSFIDDLPGHKDSVAITTAIINIARSLDLKVVAEGVEKVEQLRFLEKNGCDQIQGYYYSPPVSESTMETFLRQGCLLHNAS